MTTYVYNHPRELGLGQHHADGPLTERPAQPDEVAAALRSAIEVINPTEEQRAQLEAFLARTMHDLDMHHGTEVDLEDEPDEQGNKIVTWTDQHGDARRTSIDPIVFEEWFTPKEAAA